MKKYFNFPVLVLAILLFTGCSNEENVTGGIDKTDPQGTIGFSFPMNKEAVTYAGTSADGTVVVAKTGESVVTSVRIYMFEMTGSKLLKASQIFSAADLANNSGKAFFNVGTTTTGAATFYAVANADFHVPAASLETLVVGTTTLADFQRTISNNTGTTLLVATDAKGLLMTGFREVANVLAPTVAETAINLKRRVARFDVENDKALTNFEISTIYVSKANYSGYITAEVATGTTIATGKINPIVYNGNNTGQLDQSVFYLWPTTLDIAQIKTTISIEGTLGGVKQLYQVQPTADISIRGNYRYILKTKATALNQVTFEIITVDIWNDGVIIDGDKTTDVTTFSALTNPTPGTSGVFNSTVDGATVNYNASDATTTAILQITATSNRSDATAFTIEDFNGTESAGASITVTQNENVTYAGAAYTTVYNINIPKQTTPVDRKITIAEVANPSNKREIVIKAVPNYASTSIKPVLYQGTYWAPVNVGATTIDATTLNEASLGRMYQWGRNNISWAPNMTSTPFTDVIQGAATAAQAADGGIYAANFILPTNSSGDWLTPSNPNLWLGDNATPCPTGWRLPTKAELTTLVVAYTNVDATTHRLVLAGTVAGTTLYLPSRGGKRSTVISTLPGQGEMYSPTTYVFYWGADAAYTGSGKPAFSISSTSVSVATTQGASNGIFIRCVQK